MKSGETRGSEWVSEWVISSAWDSAALKRDNRSDILKEEQLAMGWIGRVRGEARSFWQSVGELSVWTHNKTSQSYIFHNSVSFHN